MRDRKRVKKKKRGGKGAERDRQRGKERGNETGCSGTQGVRVGSKHDRVTEVLQDCLWQQGGGSMCDRGILDGLGERLC